MADSKKRTDLIAASFEALDRYEEAQEAVDEGGERRPAPGDVYVLEATKDFGVEWAVVAHDPADPSRFLVVPADGHVLAGSADVELEDDSPVGALKLRCRFGTWTDAALLSPELRVGVLGTEGLVRARQRWLDVGDGGLTGDVLGREVDDDPGYQDWVDGVLVGARRALIEAQESEERPEIAAAVEVPKDEPVAPAAWRRQGSMFFRIAASIVVAVASVHLWRLNERVQDLETASRGAEERHGAAIRRLETERDRIVAERNRLQVRQQELEAAGAENEREARELRERVAVLDRQLEEAEKASEVVNPAIVVFSPPDDVQRGKAEVTLSPKQSVVVLLLPLREPSPAPQYRLKVRMKDSQAAIWTVDELVLQMPGEIRAGVPVRVLKQGEYVLELLALEYDTFRRVATYNLTVLTSSDIPKG